MPSRRKPKPMPGRRVLPPEVPEAAQPAPPAAGKSTEDDALPDDLRRMLEAAYT